MDKLKGRNIARIVKRVFPSLRFSIYFEKNALCKSNITFQGKDKGYTFAIRLALTDFERLSTDALAEAYIEALKIKQSNKEIKLVRR